MNCKLLKNYNFDCGLCPHGVPIFDEGVVDCTNENEDDFEEDSFERTY